jgi:hypothetical protein
MEEYNFNISNCKWLMIIVPSFARRKSLGSSRSIRKNGSDRRVEIQRRRKEANRESG